MTPVSPARVLERANQVLPRGCWYRMETGRHILSQEVGFPDPEIAWAYREVLREVTTREMGEISLNAMRLRDTATMHLCAALPLLLQWRLTRGLYDFDETLRAALAETDMTKIPIGVLGRLPEYAPYITLNGYAYGGKNLHGAWVSLSVPKTGSRQIQVAAHYGGGKVLSLVLDLVSNNLLDCIEATIKNTEEGYRQVGAALPSGLELLRAQQDADMRFWRLILSHVLYLCSQKPDISGMVLEPQPNPKRKYSMSYLVPQRDNMLEVGFKHGGAIRMWQPLGHQRQSDSSGLGMPKAPHIRKAHWHLYWTGEGRTIPEVKWVPPVAVNVKDFDAMPVTVRPVLDDPADAADRDPDAAWERDNAALLRELKK